MARRKIRVLLLGEEIGDERAAIERLHRAEEEVRAGLHERLPSPEARAADVASR